MNEDHARKELEKELHDQLRGESVDDPFYTSNRKFYSINRGNIDFVKQWLLERCSGKKVLDYCCGEGRFTNWIAENGAEAYGIDISPVSIANAQSEAEAKGLNPVFSVMDAEAMDFPSQYFDYAVVNGVLHHLDLHKAYAELARVLKPDGSVIATEALKHNPLIHYYRKRTPHLRSEWEVGHILGKQEIEAGRTYFSQVRVLRFFHLATLAAIPFRRQSFFPRVLTFLESVDSLLLGLPAVRWQAWMAVFELSSPRVEKPVSA